MQLSYQKKFLSLKPRNPKTKSSNIAAFTSSLVAVTLHRSPTSLSFSFGCVPALASSSPSLSLVLLPCMVVLGCSSVVIGGKYKVLGFL